VDTNFVWRPRKPDGKWAAGMIQDDVWRKLLKRFPDILIVPEFGYPEYFGHVGVYSEYDMGYRGTRAAVKRMYPDAFHVAVIEDADPHEKHDLMVRNVREGDCLMTFAFGMTRNARAQVHIYAEAKILDAGQPEGLAGMDEPRLVRLLTSGDLRERFYAARALGERGGAGAAAALRRVVADANAPWLVRKNAVLALGRRKDAAAVKVLLPLLERRKPDLRHFAAEALGLIGKPALKPVMQALEQGKGAYCVTAVGRIGDRESADMLIRMLDDKRFSRQTGPILEALGMIGGPKATAKLTEVLNSDRRYTRVAAANALGEIGTGEAVKALKDARAAEQAKPKDQRWGHFIWAVGRVLNRVDR
jgi:hypothetical protein